MVSGTAGTKKTSMPASPRNLEKLSVGDAGERRCLQPLLGYKPRLCLGEPLKELLLPGRA